jgi:hypothetical protein
MKSVFVIGLFYYDRSQGLRSIGRVLFLSLEHCERASNPARGVVLCSFYVSMFSCVSKERPGD